MGPVVTVPPGAGRAHVPGGCCCGGGWVAGEGLLPGRPADFLFI